MGVYHDQWVKPCQTKQVKNIEVKEQESHRPADTGGSYTLSLGHLQNAELTQRAADRIK